MRIIPAPANLPQICPICTRTLGNEVHSRCSRCGAVFHHACSLAMGNCPIMGCEGPVDRIHKAQTFESRWAVITRPPQDTSEAQQNVVAHIQNCTIWDAKQHLAGRLPVVLGYYSRQEAEAHLKRLEGVQMECYAIEATAISRRDRFVVRSIVQKGQALILATEQRMMRAIEPSSVYTLLIIRYAYEIDEERDIRGRNKRKTKTIRINRINRALHIYQGDLAPIVIEETTLSNYKFLGPDETESGMKNFTLLEERLAKHAKLFDKNLERLGAQRMRHVPSPGGKKTITTNRIWVDGEALLEYVTDQHLGWQENQLPTPPKPVETPPKPAQT
ncbi:MAG TPA: hypothetical protein VFF73_36295 [Planctomycetota bacterium]|nr:hypothetical protein [Planctomycetota bacterium]